MYYWNIKALKSELRSKTVSQKDSFLYVLLSVVISAVGLEIAMCMPKESLNSWDYFYSIGTVLCVTLGTLWTYRRNGGDSGEDFVLRYFSIGWVIGFRLIPLLLLLIALFVVLGSNEEDEIPTQWWESVGFLVWYVLYYWRSGENMRSIALSRQATA